MKKTTVLGIGLFSLALLGTLAPVAAHATVTSDGKGSTGVTVKVTDDNTDPTEPGNIDDDPGKGVEDNGDALVLKNVPDVYNFETALKASGTYSLTSDQSKIEDADDTPTDGTSFTAKTIAVFNNNSKRTWTVTAAVDNDQLAITGGADTAAVTGFTITTDSEHQLVGTGANAVVFENAGTDVATNTGYLTTAVSQVGIDFTDTNSKLKADSELTGTITYTLANTSQPDDAQPADGTTQP